MTASEQYLYGSARVGVFNRNLALSSSLSLSKVTVPGIGDIYSDDAYRGRRQYELSNHLGNVLATISDKKLWNSGTSSFAASVLSVADYYPFGMQMPGRTVSAGGYRYGFNGKEMDNEVSGSGNQYDYGFRIYNSRIGRFLSVDPLTKGYPMLTPYQFASNRPIDGVDLDGLEWKKIETYNPKTGVTNIHFQVQLKVVNDSKVFKDVETLKAEIQGQFANAFEGRKSKDGNTTYSASIDVSFAADISKNSFEAIIDDYENGPLKGSSPAANTQTNAFGVPAGEWENDPE